MDISQIKSMNDEARASLEEVGVCTTTQLLEQAASPADRLKLADLTHLNPETIKLWAYQADLLRVDGVTPELADVLCRAGVATVPKLAYHSANTLGELLDERIGDDPAIPDRAHLERIIARAKKLPKMIRH